MRAILMSIKPQHVANILNGIKTLEIRKHFPKDYVGWVYIYCTKGKTQLIKCQEKVWGWYKLTKGALGSYFNGKVVARFWCDKVEEIEHRLLERHYTATLNDKELLTKSCLSHEEIHNYLRTNIGYAIHITNLEVFDKPKELSEFKSYKKNIVNTKINGMVFETELDNSLIKAPQSWCYVEI